MKCAFCPHSIHTNDDFVNTIFDPTIIQEIVKNATRFYIHGDGEPLSSPIFLDCIPDPVPNSCEFIFYTSGMPLNTKIIKTLIKKQVTWMSISIDAGDKITYNKMRGDYWDVLWKNIKNVIRLKKDSYYPILSATMMICNSNIHTLPLLVTKLIQLKHFMSLIIYRPNQIAEKLFWSDSSGTFLFDEEINIDNNKEYQYILEAIDIARNNNFNLKAIGKFLNHDYQHTTM
jgi:MoaA/NifB/PqqE/SkfB family radical SAM enzyme